MAENVDRPVVPAFSPETMGKNILSFQTPDKAAELEEYCFQHLDTGNEDGESNIRAFREYFDQINHFLGLPESPRLGEREEIQKLINEVCAWSGSTDGLKVPSEEQRLRFNQNWSKLHEVLHFGIPSMIKSPILDDLLGFIDDYSLGAESFHAIYPEWVDPNAEPEKVEEPEVPEEKETVDEEEVDDGTIPFDEEKRKRRHAREEAKGKKKTEREAEPEPEEAPERERSEFRDGMALVMRTSPDKQPEMMATLLENISVEELGRWFTVINYGGSVEMAREMRSKSTPDRRLALLELLGFSSAPSAREYFVRMRVISQLLDGQKDSPQKNAMMRILAKALGLLHPELMTDENPNDVLAGAESIGAKQFDAYFAREASESTSTMSLDGVQREMSRILGLPDAKKTIELRQFMESMDGKSLRALFAPLLSTNLNNAVEHRRTPGHESVRKVILAMCGFSAPPAAKTMYERIIQLQSMLENVLRMPDLSSVSGVKEAYNRGFNKRTIDAVTVYKEAIPLALMHMVPDEMVSKLASENWGPEWLRTWTDGEGHTDNMLSEPFRRSWERGGQLSDKDLFSIDPDHSGYDAAYLGKLLANISTKVAGATAGAVGGALEGGARAAAEMARRTTKALGPSASHALFMNKLLALDEAKQYNAWFDKPASSPVSEEAAERAGVSEVPSSEGGRDGILGALNKGSKLMDKHLGEKTSSWVKGLGLAYLTVAGTEWAVRGAGTFVSRGYSLAKKTLKTGVNVVSAPFQGVSAGARDMWNRGWNKIEAPKQNELPKDSPWYKRWANSSWYSTRKLTRGTAAFVLGGALATGGALAGGAMGTGAMIGEGLGLRYSNEVAEGPDLTVDAVVKAVDGKMSEDALRELAEIEDPGEAVQKVMAELGEGGKALLEDAGLMTAKSKSFADRFTFVEDAGLWSMGADFFGGAKELAIDNTVKAATLTGSGAALSFVVGGGKIPTFSELNTYLGVLDEVGDTYMGHYATSEGWAPLRAASALAKLSSKDQLKVTRGFAQVFDLDEIEGVRGTVFGSAPEVFDLITKFTHPERRFTPVFGSGMGPALAPNQVKLMINHPDTVDKIQSEQAYLFGFDLAGMRPTLMADERGGHPGLIRAQKSELLQLQRALKNFVGAKKLTAGTVDLYKNRIKPTLDALEVERSSSPVADLLYGLYKNAYDILDDSALMPRVIDPGIVERVA